MIWLSGFCFGFALAVLLNTKLNKDRSPLQTVLKHVMPVEKHRARVPGKKDEDVDFWEDE